MNRALVDQIAAAVLYEGYILYPYRPSLKNRQRWTFGGLFPRAFSEVHIGSDPWSMQTQCLVVGSPRTTLHVEVRFLHLIERTVGELTGPEAEWTEESEPAFRPVESLQVGETRFHSWQEATERQIVREGADLCRLLERPEQRRFTFPAQRTCEPLREPGGAVVGVLERRQQAIEGSVELSAERVGDGVSRMTVQIANQTDLRSAPPDNRDEVLMRSLVSTHTILHADGGEFVSLIDPPEPYRAAAAGCRNVGAWPVLVGEEGETDAMLSAPIILYDYPQIAPESPGDLFDGTEIDEILTLRVLTLTDEEKREVAGVDQRSDQLLRRTEALAREQLLSLHGTFRGLRPTAGGSAGE